VKSRVKDSYYDQRHTHDTLTTIAPSRPTVPQAFTSAAL
jgi:hypothetical protein